MIGAIPRLDRGETATQRRKGSIEYLMIYLVSGPHNQVSFSLPATTCRHHRSRGPSCCPPTATILPLVLARTRGNRLGCDASQTFTTNMVWRIVTYSSRRHGCREMCVWGWTFESLWKTHRAKESKRAGQGPPPHRRQRLGCSLFWFFLSFCALNGTGSSLRATLVRVLCKGFSSTHVSMQAGLGRASSFRL